MTKKEFEKKWDKELLEVLHFIVGRKTNMPESINCYKDGNEWIMSDVGERQDEYIVLRGDEETVFDELNNRVEFYYKRAKEKGDL